MSSVSLSNLVKMQYLQIKSIVNTSIECQISGQSTHGKRLNGHMFDMVATLFSYGRALIVC